MLHIYVNPGLTSLRELSHVLNQRYQNTFGVDLDFGNDGARLRRLGLADVATAVKRKRSSQARNIRWAILESQGRAPRWRAMAKRSESAFLRTVLGK